MSVVNLTTDPELTAAIATVTAALAAHEGDSTGIHGVADMSVLQTAAQVAALIAAHEADTTNVHGIADTTMLVLKSLFDAKGDLFVATADNAIARLAVGTDGQLLVADAASTPGVKWGPTTPGSGSSSSWPIASGRSATRSSTWAR